MVDEIQVKENQVLKIIKVFRDRRAGKPWMNRLDDFELFRQSIREGEPVGGSVATMK